MISLRSLLAPLAITVAIAGCKRQVDVLIPDSGATVAATTATTTTSAPTATTPDPVEPLATLSSGRVAAPMPLAPKTGDAGAKPDAATAGTGVATLPTGAPTGLPTGAPTGIPTGLPTPPGTDPQECQAAKLLRQLGRTNEAETLRVKCVEKGGKDPFS